jgi:hypothetical protein
VDVEMGEEDEGSQSETTVSSDELEALR